MSVRNALFRRVERAALRQWWALAELDPTWPAERWEAELAPYFDEHDTIGTGPSARAAAMLDVEESGGRTWRVRQILEDPAGFHEWALVATVDLDASDAAGEVVLQLEGVERL